MGLYLITDRTQADVNRLKTLNKKKWAGMTAAERSYWFGGVTQDLTESTGQALTDSEGESLSAGGGVVKGGYNYEDLNRVEYAVQVLAEDLTALGYPVSVSVKTDWDQWDIPTVTTMERYIGNLNALRNAVGFFKTTTTAPPSSMQRLTYDGANRIEQMLQQIETWTVGMINTRNYVGEYFCGEI